MASALSHLENAVFQFKFVVNFLRLYSDVLKCPKKKAVSVMDVGCGSGRTLLEHLLPALPTDFQELIGVDKYDAMIEYCGKLEVDPRVSFRQLDIQTQELPKEFENRFDLITSFFCFHYVTDFSQALRNMHKMLKPGGELLFIQPTNSNPLYLCYRELSKIDKWRSLFKEFDKYTLRFRGKNRDAELKEYFQRNGFTLDSYLFMTDFMEIEAKHFINTFKALDGFRDDIPVDEQDEYLKAFHECFSIIEDVDFVNEESLERKTKFSIEFLSVHARKDEETELEPINSIYNNESSRALCAIL